ncbi:MAG: VOC family protein [Acidobacteria bacterium]|nr:VOC family protein [Acidobacteriota bacterium]
MSLSTYLTFDGSCREAFEFYRSVFGGEFQSFQTFADAPPDLPVPEAEKNQVMHVSLPIGSSVLMGSDRGTGFGPPVVVGNNFSIALDGESREDVDRVFAALSEGGNVIMPLQETFWGAYYGLWTDKFGINWMANYTLPTK